MIDPCIDAEMDGDMSKHCPCVLLLREEIDRLHAALADYQQNYQFAKAKAEALERQDAVAFLRGDAEWPSCTACHDATLYAHADAIERGEHRRKEER